MVNIFRSPCLIWFPLWKSWGPICLPIKLFHHLRIYSFIILNKYSFQRSLYKALLIPVISMEFNQLPKVLLIFTLSFLVKVTFRRHRGGTDTRYQYMYSIFLQYSNLGRAQLPACLWDYFPCTSVLRQFQPTVLKLDSF